MMIDKLTGSRVHFEVTVPKETFEEGLDKAFEKKNQEVEIKGFRKGKAPRKAYEAKFGVESLYEEALNHVLQETYYDAVTENDIDVVAQPKIDLDVNEIERGKDFSYGVTVAVRPDVKLGEYMNLEVEKEPGDVTDEDLEERINRELEQQAELVLKEEGEVEEGDTAVFDFEGSVDGEPFEGGSAENYQLEIGSGRFIPGFEEQMTGMKPEEEKDITVTFPEDYQQESLAGKEAVFHVKLHEIKQRHVPELTDEFVKDLEIDDVSTVEEYKEHLKSEMLEQKKKANEEKVMQSVIKKAADNAEFEIPEEMVKQEADKMYKNAEQQVKQYGMDFDTYLQYLGKDKDKYKEELNKQAKETLRQRLTIEAIGKEEEIEVTEEEVKDKYEEIADQYKAQNVTLEQVKQSIPETAVKDEVRYKKAIDFLVENAKVTE